MALIKSISGIRGTIGGAPAKDSAAWILSSLPQHTRNL